MKRKLIAMDLDGTAADSKGNLAVGVKKALLAARSSGHAAAFVTGRADMDMIPIEKECSCVDYLILNNGAKLIREQDQRVLINEVLDKREVKRLFNCCMAAGIQIYITSQKECYASRRSRRLDRYLQSIGCRADYIEDFDKAPTDRIEGVTILGEEALVREIFEREQIRLRAVASEPCCVDVTNPRMDKWGGIKALLSLLHMGPEDVIAIGDYDNDLEMIQQAGIGVAVGNARECIKAAASYVTLHDNDHGAVADAVNELVLGRTRGMCVKQN